MKNPFVIAVVLGILLAACNPSPKAKAILADEAIRAEICATFKPYKYSKDDTQRTKDFLEAYNNGREAYCNG